MSIQNILRWLLNFSIRPIRLQFLQKLSSWIVGSMTLFMAYMIMPESARKPIYKIQMYRPTWLYSVHDLVMADMYMCANRR